jgi:hypothetical protein
MKTNVVPMDMKNIPAQLRPHIAEVVELLKSTNKVSVPARFRLGQVVDMATDAGVGLEDLSRIFRVSEAHLRKSMAVAKAWSKNDLDQALEADPLLTFDHFVKLCRTDAEYRPEWLTKVRTNRWTPHDLMAAGREKLRSANPGSAPADETGAVVALRAVRTAGSVLRLAGKLEELAKSKLSHEQIDEISKMITEAYMKLSVVEHKLRPRLRRSA